LLERGEFAFERLALARIERAGEVAHALGQCGDRLDVAFGRDRIATEEGVAAEREQCNENQSQAQRPSRLRACRSKASNAAPRDPDTAGGVEPSAGGNSALKPPCCVCHIRRQHAD
jgi:hypothetical protein